MGEKTHSRITKPDLHLYSSHFSRNERICLNTNLIIYPFIFGLCAIVFYKGHAPNYEPRVFNTHASSLRVCFSQGEVAPNQVEVYLVPPWLCYELNSLNPSAVASFFHQLRFRTILDQYFILI